MKNQEKRRVQRKIALFCIFVEFLLLVAFLFFYLPKIKISSADSHNIADDRKNCLMFVGFSEDTSFLKRAYDGAIRAAEKYDSVVALHIQDSRTEPENFQNLMDFAYDSGADGIIAYVPERMQFSRAAKTGGGTHVPLVFIGNRFDGTEQVSSIGGNYSEMGKKLADEVLELWEDKMTLIIFDSFSAHNSNSLSIRNAFISGINSKGIKNFLSLDHSVNSYKTMLVTHLNRLNRLEKKVMLVSLSEPDSLYAVQKISMLSYVRNTKVLGIGENEILKKYLDTGIVSVLVSMDYEKMGEDAVAEIFEHKEDARSVGTIPAGIKIIKAGGK